MEALQNQLQQGWEQIYDVHSPNTWVSFVPLGLLLTAYWIFGLLHLYLDVYKWPAFLYQFKLQKAERACIKPPMVRALLTNVLTSQALIFLPLALVFYYTYSADNTIGIRCDRTLPHISEVFGHFAIFLVVEEVLFFYSHWALHQPALYARIHKVHHQFTAPVALAAIYAHPVEVVLSNIFPMILGPLLCNAHVATYTLWAVLGIIVTQVHHCGYRFPWTPPWDHQPDFHDYHHEYFNRGNYGLLGVMDWLHGTDKPWRESMAKKAAEEVTSQAGKKSE